MGIFLIFPIETMFSVLLNLAVHLNKSLSTADPKEGAEAWYQSLSPTATADEIVLQEIAEHSPRVIDGDSMSEDMVKQFGSVVGIWVNGFYGTGNLINNQNGNPDTDNAFQYIITAGHVIGDFQMPYDPIEIRLGPKFKWRHDHWTDVEWQYTIKKYQ